MLRNSCLIVLVTLSAGCACLKPFPAKHVWEYDPKGKVCGQYAIVAYDPKLQFKHVKDVPLAQCPAIFGFTAAEMPKVLDWSEDALRCSKQNCR